MKPFLVMSDLHYHAWSAFAVEKNNLNSRLKIQIAETVRAAKALRSVGGNEIILTGDLFHVRGSLKPSVLNPVVDLYRKLVKAGYKVHAIPGNHDLEKNESIRAGNSITSLEEVGVMVYHKTTKVGNKVFTPWQPSIDALLEELSKYAGSGYDAFIHAPVDGVLPHIPSSNLTPEVLWKLGYNRVFAGHYHNHVDFGRGIYSVGALTHQTWSDIDSRAGYLLVSDDGVAQHATKAPKFIELDGEETEHELENIVPGNYIRIQVTSSDPEEIAFFKSELLKLGAAGVIVNPIRSKGPVRKGVVKTKSVSLEQSISDYIKEKKFSDEAATQAHQIVRDLT